MKKKVVKKTKKKPVRDKSQKWIELAMYRLSKVQKYSEGLESLANTNNYTYTPKQVENLLLALNDIVNNVKETYLNKGKNINSYTL